MTFLVRVHLGTAPGSGKHALDQTTAFKRQVRSLLATPPGASLLAVTDHGATWIEAVYSTGTPGAEAWAERATGFAPEVWRTLAERRAARGR